MKLYERYFKRLLDIILSLFAIIVLFPLLIIIALLVRLKLGSPVLFIQERPGLNNRIFKMYKFRTMTDEKNSHDDFLPDNLRTSKLGNILRKLSLDELPELINIAKGDMSFVGPRPLLVEYLPFYTAEETKRHNVRPGLTGLAQIYGRSSLSWEERFSLDLEYIKRYSFLLDFKILLFTMKNFFLRSDIAEVEDVRIDEMGEYIQMGEKTIRRLDVERAGNNL